VTPRTNPVYRSIVAVLDQHGIDFSLRRLGKHASVCFAHGGRQHKVVLAVSPSDRRAPANARSYVRRLLR
jgi:hypothetical protein